MPFYRKFLLFFPVLVFFSSVGDEVQSLAHVRTMFYLAFEFGLFFVLLFFFGAGILLLMIPLLNFPVAEI